MNKFFAILIMCSLSLPVFAVNGQEDEMTPINTENLEVLSPEEINELNNTSTKDITPVSEALPSKLKEPVGKKNLAKKFIIAMLCVAGTSILLYGTLSLYNKVRDNLFSQGTVSPEGEQPLDTPCDLTDAVKSFIDKTHWDN